MRKPSGGDIHRKCLNLHHAVNISDEFMELIEKCITEPTYDDSWKLIDPHTNQLVMQDKAPASKSLLVVK